MSAYSEGLKHGWADAEKAVREILDREISDDEKIKRLRWLVAPLTDAEQQP